MDKIRTREYENPFKGQGRRSNRNGVHSVQAIAVQASAVSCTAAQPRKKTFPAPSEGHRERRKAAPPGWAELLSSEGSPAFKRRHSRWQEKRSIRRSQSFFRQV